MSVNIANETAATFLRSAAAKGHVEIFREFLNRCARVDFRDDNDKAPLIEAALKGHLETVSELFNFGANVNTVMIKLILRLSTQHAEFFPYLLKRGTSANFRKYNGLTYKTAASNGHVEVVRELLNHGPKVDITNINGLALLKAAASKGNFGVFRELLNRGASVDNAK